MKLDEIKELIKNHVKISKDEIKEIFFQSNWNYKAPKVKRLTWGRHPNAFEEDCWGNKFNYNELGYRSDSFKGDNDGFLFLGCSMTEGHALEEYETWPWIVGKHFDVSVWNVAHSGEGDDVCLINAIKWIPELKPKVVCMLIPPVGRFKFFDQPNKMRVEFYSYRQKEAKRLSKFDFLFNNKHQYMATLKNVLSISHICKDYDIPFICESWKVAAEKFPNPRKADDGHHKGVEWQQSLAEQFIDEIGKCI